MYQKNKSDIQEVLVPRDITIKEALKRLGKTARKVLLVVDREDKLIGTITDGDARKFLLKGIGLESKIEGVFNDNPKYIYQGEESSANNLLIKNRIQLLPVVNEARQVVNFITLYDIVSDSDQHHSTRDEKHSAEKKQLDVPVVIMAGGKGTRLAPFTKILPKPLIPIGEKPMLEIVIDEFRTFGVKDFFLTLNYKGELIESYFNGNIRDYRLEYLWEDEYLGTAGSLKLLGGVSDHDTFIVSNCDIIVKADFCEVLNFHHEENAALTVLSSIQHYKIPYGVVSFSKGGYVTEIVEKPEYSFTVNTGVYLINKDILKYIPEKSHLDMPELINILLSKKKKVITYPVNEKEYIDIGQWKEYKNALEQFDKLWESH